jgi:hypothetical protein
MRNKRFSVQIDKVADYNGIDHLVVYMQYVEVKAQQLMKTFFCLHISRMATAKELFKIFDDFMK